MKKNLKIEGSFFNNKTKGGSMIFNWREGGGAVGLTLSKGL